MQDPCDREADRLIALVGHNVVNLDESRRRARDAIAAALRAAALQSDEQIERVNDSFRHTVCRELSIPYDSSVFDAAKRIREILVDRQRQQST